MGAEDYRDGWVSASWVKASKSLPQEDRGHREFLSQGLGGRRGYSEFYLPLPALEKVPQLLHP
jgi:hypothetical protein